MAPSKSAKSNRTPMPIFTNTFTIPVSWQMGRRPSAHMRELVRICAIASLAAQGSNPPGGLSGGAGARRRGSGRGRRVGWWSCVLAGLVVRHAAVAGRDGHRGQQEGEVDAGLGDDGLPVVGFGIDEGLVQVD